MQQVVVYRQFSYKLKIFTNKPNIQKTQQARNIKLQNNLITYIFFKSL